jgi:hypothetical protein
MPPCYLFLRRQHGEIQICDEIHSKRKDYQLPRSGSLSDDVDEEESYIYFKLDKYCPSPHLDHIDFNPENHCANNLQFLTPQENTERSNIQDCRIWKIGKEDTKTEYPSVVAAIKEMGYTTVHKILKNNTYKNWCGEYL